MKELFGVDVRLSDCVSPAVGKMTERVDGLAVAEFHCFAGSDAHRRRNIAEDICHPWYIFVARYRGQVYGLRHSRHDTV